MSTSTKQKPGDCVLSVREAVAYIAKHYHGGEPGLMSESTVRRCIGDAECTYWLCTRTAAGHYGITVCDLRKRFHPVLERRERLEAAGYQVKRAAA